jgi:hypothetical protein
MDKGRVGEDRGSKETDGCPLTGWDKTSLANCVSLYFVSSVSERLCPMSSHLASSGFSGICSVAAIPW